MTIGENIKNIRKKANLSQKALAEKLGVSQQMIAQYEKGKRQPKIETIDKIATALGVRIVDITRDFKFSDYQKTSEFQRLERSVDATKGIIAILTDIYGSVEDKTVSGQYASTNYYLVGKGDNQFILDNGIIEALYESTKASIPPLIECMKSNLSEDDYIKECLQDLSNPELLEEIQEFERTFDNQNQE